MSRCDGRAWRALRTGMAFVVFGAGSLLLGGVVLPLIGIAPLGRGHEVRAQWVIHQSFRLFLRLVVGLRLLRITEHGIERLTMPGGRVIVANHPTLIDIVVLIALLPQADCIVKRAAWDNRYLRRVIQLAGYIPNDAGPQVVAKCLERLRQGHRLILFPEGTRSPRERLGPFYRGAARIAIASGCEIIPVVIRCDPPLLGKGESWFHVPAHTAHVTVDVQDAVSPLPYVRHAADGAASRELTEHLRHLFERRLAHATS